MDFSSNFYNSKSWILDTVQKVLLSKANTEKRLKKERLKKPHNPSIENQNCEKSPAKTHLISEFYNSKTATSAKWAFLLRNRQD